MDMCSMSEAVIWVLKIWRGFGQWLQLMHCTVLCHHSPRQISLTFRQDPLYLVGDLCLYMQHPFNKPWQSWLPSSSLFPSTFYFLPIFASIWAEPSASHIISSFTTASSIMSVCQKATALTPWFISFQRQAMECGGKWDNGDSKWRQGATQRQ